MYFLTSLTFSPEALDSRHFTTQPPRPSAGALAQSHSGLPLQTQLAKSHFKSARAYLPMVKFFRCQRAGLNLGQAESAYRME